ncbi:helix-turn-helix domain-containing protein [Microcella sp.]|uniref:helix-turn-helix domain-containing protein n=1 Tax=Microcella sp. TaxID=1913979 RepID=UPI00391969FA
MTIQTIRPTFTKGDRLRKARELTGLDQKAFAETMGLHRDSVRKYETTGQIKKYVLKAWAEETGVDEDWLEHGDEPQPSD